MDQPRLSDRPIAGNGAPEMGWGSDAIVEQLSRLNLRYIALVPGSSYRGVHDSLVNYKGNTAPEMLMCLHEEHCIAIAHGYAKATSRPMAAAVHANVGLMHATMAIYNAFCDRIPMVILGATGPVDAAKRRPWIDWIHTAGDQGALVRPFVKFDDQPCSVNAAVMSLVRAAAMAIAKPCAPVYVCLDVNLQEDKIDHKTIHFPETSRYFNTSPPGPGLQEVKKVAAELTHSKRPLFLFGRMNREQMCWNERIELAEKFDARVSTDLKQASTFPTTHRLHIFPPTVFSSPQASELIRSADLIISFEWVDLAGTLQAAYPAGTEPTSKIIHISLDSALHNGWSKDHFGFPPADIAISAEPDKFVTALLAESKQKEVMESEWGMKHNLQSGVEPETVEARDKIFMRDLATALYSTIDPDQMCLIRVPLGWRGADLRSTHPLAYLGQDGGAGIASGPGQAVGAALALKDMNEDKGTSYVPVAILGDGDYLMGSSALWTAARYKLPLLVIVANNASFFNDEVHQERVARMRDRPVENKWIGMRIDDPLPDLSQNAASLGLTVLSGQVRSRNALGALLGRAVNEVKGGKTVLVDVQVLPDGYSSALEKAK
jgi:thiamine pyrophosphate-dependent acetolactate synthase large subunit-like protein